MNLRRIAICLCLMASALSTGGRAEESNLWPGPVRQRDKAGQVKSWTALGPLLFDEPTSDGDRITGFRPFYVRREAGDQAEVTTLYPIFYYRSYQGSYVWR